MILKIMNKLQCLVIRERILITNQQYREKVVVMKLKKKIRKRKIKRKKSHQLILNRDQILIQKKTLSVA